MLAISNRFQNTTIFRMFHRFIRTKFMVQNRLKSTGHLYKGKIKTPSTELALQHYDNFYSKVYETRWQSIRLGLLSPKKYMAIVNNFVDSESVEIQLRQCGANNLRYVYQKNLKKIVKHFKQRKHYQIESGRASLPAESIGDDQNPLDSDDLEMQTESETETLERFFTDFNEEVDSLIENRASMDIDLNDFVPVSELKYRENIAHENEKNYFNFYEMDHQIPLTRIQESSLNISPFLNLYTFDRNDFSMFEPAKIGSTNLFNHYLIDGASTLPVLALDIQDGDHVADLCSAPGGKSLLMCLMLKKDVRLFLNDVSKSRYERLRNVFDSFIPKSYQTSIQFSNEDVLKLKRYQQFDKVLVDVPCTNDRHSLYSAQNNIFSSKRLQERINIPQKQMDILIEAMMSVRIGGTIVYCTCSLSPIQNDGVVHMALKRIQQTSAMDFSPVHLKQALRPLKHVFEIDSDFQYGVQILPHISCNFGPMYFCKLIRNK